MILSRLDRRILVGCGAIAVLAAAAWVVPRALVDRARDQSVACLDDARGPTDARTCDGAEADLARLASVPWVKHDATYRYEELRARRALAAYDDVTVLAPSAAGRKRAADAVAREEEVVEKGSERLTLDELGSAIAAPNVAAAAAFRGDREALRERYDHIGLWYLRVASIEAALFDGDAELVDKIAARYAEFDPRDADLRTTVGSALCLGPDPGRGLEILARVPGDRAEKRYAAIARDYGEVRAVQEACADLASIEPPPMPVDRHAGVPDADEARAVQALRLAKGEVELREARADVRALLVGDAAPSGSGLDTRVASARAALLAELVVSDTKLSADDVADLAKPRTSLEPPLAPEGALDVVDVLRDPRGEAPYVSPDTFARAGARARELSRTEDLAPERAMRLEDAARAFDFFASLGFARAGEAERAADAAKRAGAGDARPMRVASRLASALLAATDFDDARAVIRDARPPWEAPGSAPKDDTPEGREARSLARELFALAFDDAVAAAALGLAEEARVAAGRARSLAAVAADPALAARARVVVLATAKVVAPGDTNAGDPLLAAMGGSEDDRRNARRAVYASRGNAPSALAPYAIALGRLAPSGAPGVDVETWLDAALAIDARRFSMREVAFARLVAARSRGDTASAQAWERRLASLRTTFADARRAVIARFLGI